MPHKLPHYVTECLVEKSDNEQGGVCLYRSQERKLSMGVAHIPAGNDTRHGWLFDVWASDGTSGVTVDQIV